MQQRCNRRPFKLTALGAGRPKTAQTAEPHTNERNPTARAESGSPRNARDFDGSGDGDPGAIRTHDRSLANELRSSPCSYSRLLLVGAPPPSFGGWCSIQLS